MSRIIEVRLTQSKDVRVEKGKRVERLGPDPERIGAAIHDQLQEAVRERYGPDVEVRCLAAKQADVRLIGGYSDKPGEVKAAVWALLGEALEHLDADALT